MRTSMRAAGIAMKTRSSAASTITRTTGSVLLPRMWSQLQRNLDNPALADLKLWFDRHAPAEVRR